MDCITASEINPTSSKHDCPNTFLLFYIPSCHSSVCAAQPSAALSGSRSTRSCCFGPPGRHPVSRYVVWDPFLQLFLEDSSSLCHSGYQSLFSQESTRYYPQHAQPHSPSADGESPYSSGSKMGPS